MICFPNDIEITTETFIFSVIVFLVVIVAIGIINSKK